MKGLFYFLTFTESKTAHYRHRVKEKIKVNVFLLLIRREHNPHLMLLFFPQKWLVTRSQDLQYSLRKIFLIARVCYLLYTAIHFFWMRRYLLCFFLAFGFSFHWLSQTSVNVTYYEKKNMREHVVTFFKVVRVTFSLAPWTVSERGVCLRICVRLLGLSVIHEYFFDDGTKLNLSGSNEERKRKQKYRIQGWMSTREKKVLLSVNSFGSLEKHFLNCSCWCQEIKVSCGGNNKNTYEKRGRKKKQLKRKRT